jgi:hypothetical protein
LKKIVHQGSNSVGKGSKIDLKGRRREILHKDDVQERNGGSGEGVSHVGTSLRVASDCHVEKSRDGIQSASVGINERLDVRRLGRVALFEGGIVTVDSRVSRIADTSSSSSGSRRTGSETAIGTGNTVGSVKVFLATETSRSFVVTRRTGATVSGHKRGVVSAGSSVEKSSGIALGRNDGDRNASLTLSVVSGGRSFGLNGSKTDAEDSRVGFLSLPLEVDDLRCLTVATSATTSSTVASHLIRHGSSHGNSRRVDGNRVVCGEGKIVGNDGDVDESSGFEESDFGKGSHLRRLSFGGGSKDKGGIGQETSLGSSSRARDTRASSVSSARSVGDDSVASAKSCLFRDVQDVIHRNVRSTSIGEELLSLVGSHGDNVGFAGQKVDGSVVVDRQFGTESRSSHHFWCCVRKDNKISGIGVSSGEFVVKIHSVSDRNDGKSSCDGRRIGFVVSNISWRHLNHNLGRNDPVLVCIVFQGGNSGTLSVNSGVSCGGFGINVGIVPSGHNPIVSIVNGGDILRSERFIASCSGIEVVESANGWSSTRSTEVGFLDEQISNRSLLSITCAGVTRISLQSVVEGSSPTGVNGEEDCAVVLRRCYGPCDCSEPKVSCFCCQKEN